MQRVFVSRRIPKVGLDRLQAHFEVDVWPDELPPSREELIRRGIGCSGLLTLLSDTIDGSVMDALSPSLKAIANFAVGYNNIDIKAARQRGIAVGNTPDVLTDATADIAVGLLLSAARQFQASIDQVRQLQWRTWDPLGLLGHELARKKIGIVGMGRIGYAVARRLHRGWDMDVLYTARTQKENAERDLNARRVELGELLKESDFISVHTDLNETTRHLFNDAAFSAMKPSAVFVNTSRGGVVDQEALYRALQDKKIFAAGLDVTDPEPLPELSPLRRLPQCIILPHIGSATERARNAMAMKSAENLIAALQGQPMPYAIA